MYSQIHCVRHKHTIKNTFANAASFIVNFEYKVPSVELVDLSLLNNISVSTTAVIDYTNLKKHFYYKENTCIRITKNEDFSFYMYIL